MQKILYVIATAGKDNEAVNPAISICPNPHYSFYIKRTAMQAQHQTIIKKINRLIPGSIRNYIRRKFGPPIYYDKYKIIPEQHHTLKKIYNIQNVESFYYKNTTEKGINKSLSTIKTDSDGAVLFHFDGKDYYHPVIIAQWGLKLLSAYKNTNKEEYIHLATIQGRKIFQKSDFFYNLPYFPYKYDKKIGGPYGGWMKAPWYSGMAQGQALSLFILLYDITGEKKNLECADKTYKTLTILREEKKEAPWLSYIDDRGYFWIEEYPMDDYPRNVLNGFIYTIMGLYDYYSVTKNGGDLLNLSLQTVEHYLPKWRNPGHMSFYCLKYKKTNKGYHSTHIKQLYMLHKITNEPYFKTMADIFYKDHPGKDQKRK